MLSRNVVSEPIRKLVTVFVEDLSDVLFPEIDAQMLASLVESVQTRADALALAEAALVAARTEHAQALAELNRSAAKALGYARVYAADNPTLTAKLADITLDRPKATKPPKRKVRRAQPPNENIAKLPLAGLAETGSC